MAVTGRQVVKLFRLRSGPSSSREREFVPLPWEEGSEEGSKKGDSSVIQLPCGCRIRCDLVIQEEFVAFVRRERYFDPRFWMPGNAPTGRQGGDEVLRRIGFRWEQQSSPVRSVTWFEAAAFCKSEGGRLPWYREWISLAHWKEGSLAEWCGDWYHPNFEGPGVKKPFHQPGRRRVAGGWIEHAEPNYTGPIGFRVVYSAGGACHASEG